MKKRLVKKIRLNRETLRVLDDRIEGVVGGATTAIPTACDPASNCATCNDTCPIRACGGTGTHTCPP